MTTRCAGIKRFAAGTLSAVFLLSALMLIFPMHGSAAGTQVTNLNFSDGDSIYNETHAPEEIIKIICGAECGEAETTYLASKGGYFFTCTPVLDYNWVKLKGIGDTISVTAFPVSYDAQNGAKVTWTPSKAVCRSVGELALTASGDSFVCTFTGVPDAESYEVTVTYNADFTISAEAANEIINRAFTDGSAKLASEAKYAEDLEKYRTAKAAYDSYRENMKTYEAELAVYQAFLTRNNAYLLRKEAYDQYLQDYQKYLSDKDLFDNYETALAAYNAAAEAYRAEEEAMKPAIEAYEKYTAAMTAYNRECEALIKRIEILDSLFVSGANGQQMYSTLKGNTVNKVMGYQDEMVAAYGGESSATGKQIKTFVTNCGTATDALRALLGQYNSIRGTATDREKFEWYKTNYEALKTNFSKLYDGLRNLYQQGAVQVGLYQGSADIGDNKNRTLRFCEFLAHLCEIFTVLDDTQLANYSGWYLENKYIGKSFILAGRTGLHGANRYTMDDFFADNPELKLTDTNSASPAGCTWPTEPEKVEKPVNSVVVPDKPEKIDEPLEPEKVEKPVPPEENVKEPVKPETVAAPGAMPEAPVFSSVDRALMTEISAGRLTKRNSVTGSTVISKTCEVQKIINADDVGEFPVVTFRNYDGSLLTHIQVRTGSIADADIPVPVIPADNEKTTYRFNGWKGTDGKIYDFGNVQADATLYPDVTETPVEYKITFSTGSGKTVKTYGYGDTPEFTGKTAKAANAQYTYTFTGWDKEFAPVTADAVYTAQYSQELRSYTVKWILSSKTYEQIYEYGETPQCPVDPLTEAVQSSSTEYFGFTGWDVTPVKVKANADYTAVYKSSWILPAKVNGTDTGLEVSSGGSSFRAVLPDGASSVDLTYLSSKAVEAGKSIILEKDGTLVTIPEKIVSALPYLNGLSASVENVTFKGAEKAATVRLMSASGERLSAAGVKVTLDIFAAGEYKALAGAAESMKESQLYAEAAGKTVVLAENDETAAVIKLYALSAAECEGGKITLPADRACEGDTVTVTLTPDTGYSAEGGNVIAKQKNGAAVEVGAETLTFIMPASDVTVSYEFKRLSFTVTFRSEGTVISSETYFYGDTLRIPDDPEKPYTETEGYVFEGWTPEIAGTVVADAEYSAVFKASPLQNDDDVKVIIPSWIYIVAAVAVAAGAFFIGRAIVKKQKKDTVGKA